MQTSSICQASSTSTTPHFHFPKHKHFTKTFSSLSPSSSSSSSAQTRLDLLDQLTGYETDSGSTGKLTIREQLVSLVGDREDDFILSLKAKDLKKVKPMTVSQKRNIKRQAYLDEVSKRNDSVFYATIGAFVILPPVVILGIAILTGYVQLLP